MDVDWSDIIPESTGFIKLGGEYYLVTLYHQLHCIQSFRQNLQEYTLGTWKANSSSRIHLEHCIEYIRQSVLCNADITLEPNRLARTPDGVIVHASSGYGVTHKCRDWKEVKRQVEENYNLWRDTDDFSVPS